MTISLRLIACMPICCGQRLGQLVVGDHLQLDGDLADQLAGPLLLLFQQRLELVFVDEAQLDEDLADFLDEPCDVRLINAEV